MGGSLVAESVAQELLAQELLHRMGLNNVLGLINCRMVTTRDL